MVFSGQDELKILDAESKEAIKSLLDEVIKLQTGSIAKDISDTLSASSEKQFDTLQRKLHNATEPLEHISEKLEASSGKLETLLESDEVVLGSLERLLGTVSGIQTREQAQFSILQGISSQMNQLGELKSDLEKVLDKACTIIGQEEEELQRLSSLSASLESQGQKQIESLSTLATIMTDLKTLEPICGDLKKLDASTRGLSTQLVDVLAKEQSQLGLINDVLKKLSALDDIGCRLGEVGDQASAIQLQEKEELSKLQEITGTIGEVRELASALQAVSGTIETMASTVSWLRRWIPYAAGVSIILLAGIVLVLLQV